MFTKIWLKHRNTWHSYWEALKGNVQAGSHALGQWFSTRDNSVSPRTSDNTQDTSGCHTWVRDVTGVQERESKILLNTHRCTGKPPTTKNPPGQRVSNPEAEDPCPNVSILHHMIHLSELNPTWYITLTKHQTSLGALQAT